MTFSQTRGIFLPCGHDFWRLTQVVVQHGVNGSVEQRRPPGGTRRPGKTCV